MDQVATLLKKARQKKGLTQQEVADKLGISQRAYAFYEDGSRAPKTQRLLQLGNILGIPHSKLITSSSSNLEQNVPHGTLDGVDEEDLKNRGKQIRLEASVNVVLFAVAELYAKIDKSRTAVSVYGEFEEAIRKEAEKIAKGQV